LTGSDAAVSLGRAPEQLTFLDAPESPISRFSGAANLIDVVLPRLRPGRDRNHPFVDSYSSAFGRPYHRKPGLSAVVDVVLTPGRPPERDPIRAINWAHLYAVDWYARSVREAGQGVGYGWSPLRGADVDALRSYYRSPRPHRPLTLCPRRDLKMLGTARRLAARQVRRTPVIGAALHLSPQISAAALILRSMPGDGLVEFDIDVLDGDGTEQIQIDVDAVTAFITEARFPVPGCGRYVMLTDGRPGERLITARLVTARRPAGGRAGDEAAAAGAQPRVSITNLTIVNWPGAVTGFSFQHAAAVTFFSGAAAGSFATLALFTTGWTVRRVLTGIVRRKRG
jgi:hypothetical protein